MADVVQFRMERMAEELDDLESRGLFSRREIAEVVRKRRDFEYRLKRPCPLKHDYLAYIEYEGQLDALRNLRKKAILGELKKKQGSRNAGDGGKEDGGEEEESSNKRRKKGKLWKRSVSDVAGLLRILDIYRMAVVRHKGDLDLWFRYLEFCRERRHGRMKQVLAQAIRFHPKVPGFWIYAAAWEFDQNLNVAAARALMQSGLRACPKSEDLWIEYLRMELTYLNKLKARKVALGEDVRILARDGGKSDEAKKWKEENSDLFMLLDEERKVVEGLDIQEGALEKKENLFWEHGSSILRTIYHGAVEALPSSMNLRKQFLEILDDVDLAHSDELKDEVMEDIKKEFSREEDYWDWIARLQICDVEQEKDLTKEEALRRLKKATQVYEEALGLLPSTKMFSLYAKFWWDIAVPERDNTISMLHSVGLNTLDFSSDILKVYERAESSGCLTEDLGHQYVSFYLQMGMLDEAKQLAEKLCNGRLSKAAKLWILRVSIEIKWLTSKSASISMYDLNHVFKLLRLAVSSLTLSETEILWHMAIKLFASKKDYFEKLVQKFMDQLVRAGGGESGYSVSSSLVNCILQRDGFKHAREMYKRFLCLPYPSMAFFRYCIELESNLAFIGDSDAILNARKLYESALSVYDKNEGLWKDYYSFEMKVGTAETANAIYWRARKTIKNITMLAPNGL